MRCSILLIGCLILAVAGATLVSAETDAGQAPAFPGQPQLPHSFYGSITSAGNPVPAGVPVEARADGVTTGVAGNPVYSKEGKYGSTDPLVPRLEVQGFLASGTPLTFYVGGIQAEVQAGGASGSFTDSYPFKPGEVTELNLRVAAAVTPVPGYTEATEPALAATPIVTLPPGGVNPSSSVMIGLICVLVVLGAVAFYLGKRADRKVRQEDQKSPGNGQEGKEE